ncbi:hypothetical protein THII_0279 [Thioploca ingrica]|uniref:Putative restriction endonuclease domain-containing protein n=1 Tax=Thioploca ingrica TaxID=40754 RepID=A0A090BU67_9GAMM|nr:hypothetical protein THII_0279 [Thioploca ingrica]
MSETKEMNAQKIKDFYITSTDYLAGEQVSPIKHEYRGGQVYAMAGAKKAHVLIGSHLTTLLNNHLRDLPCIVLGSDIKVRLESAHCFYYPDVSVTCDKSDLETEAAFISAPLLIIEILSPATEVFDRNGKFSDYRTLFSLQEYVLVSQTRIQVECFRRSSEGGEWLAQRYTRGEILELTSVHLRCPIEWVYQKVVGLE